MDEILRLPETWQKITGITILDPDGWSSECSGLPIKNGGMLINKKEFLQRARFSTCSRNQKNKDFPQDFDTDKEEVSKIFDKNKEMVSLEKAKSTIEDSWEAVIMNYNMQAKLHMAKFKELKKEGFNDEQALELSKNIYGGMGK